MNISDFKTMFRSAMVLFGEGYESINALLKGDVMELFEKSPLFLLSQQHWMLIIFLILIIFLKVIATAVTTSAGGIGGVFAPTLFVGAFTGYLVAEIANYYLGFNLPHINFALAGMAGVMSGVMLAPLTSIFLIAEISAGYSLLIPLMITWMFWTTKKPRWNLRRTPSSVWC